MINKLKLFGAGFFAFFALGLFINTLYAGAQSFFFAQQLNKNEPTFFIANISEQFDEMLKKESCPITAQSAISLLIRANNKEVIVFEKNIEQKMPIASLTKLMTAIIADEFYSPEQIITVGRKAVGQEGSTGFLKTGEEFLAQDLIELALIESSNDAAYALAEPMGVNGFIELMNLKSKDLGLEKTFFYNPTGIDPEYVGQGKNSINQSTALELARIAKYLLDKPGLIEVISQKEKNLYLADGLFHHQMTSTNDLLGMIPEVIGGKTGFTEQAGQCLLVISRAKADDSYYLNVILNSTDRFKDMEELINCVD